MAPFGFALGVSSVLRCKGMDFFWIVQIFDVFYCNDSVKITEVVES